MSTITMNTDSMCENQITIKEWRDMRTINNAEYGNTANPQSKLLAILRQTCRRDGVRGMISSELFGARDASVCGCFVIPNHGYLIWSIGPGQLFIEDVFVASDKRRRLHGLQLYTMFEDKFSFATGIGLRSTVSAIPFWDELGFKMRTKDPSFITDGGLHGTLCLMTKNL